MINMRIDAVIEATLVLDEEQVRALDAIVGYGPEAFIKDFKNQLGTAYIKPHEKGVHSLFKAVEEQVRPALWRIDEARNLLSRGMTDSESIMKYRVNARGRRYRDMP